MLINVNTNVICINNSKESNWKIDLFFNRDISRCSQVNVFTQNISKVYVAFFICHIHNHTEYNQQWNVFSAFNPSIKSAQTHLEQWVADTAAPGEQLGVRCLAQESHLSRGQFLPEPRFKPTTSVTSPTFYPLGHGCPVSPAVTVSGPSRSTVNYILLWLNFDKEIPLFTIQ